MPGKIVTPQEWRKARLDLLEQEKKQTHMADQVAKQRSEMPLVEVEKDYKFKATDGSSVSLKDVFDGHRQLIIYHVMFDPSWDAACSSCSFVVDSLPRHYGHLQSRDTNLVLISRAPAEKVAAHQKRMGWDHVKWYSSNESDFNYDFHVSFDESKVPSEYNFRSKAELEEKGMGYYVAGENQGFSVFLREDDHIYHSYSCYARGSERLHNTYTMLDMTPLGRQDVVPHKPVFKYHDEY